MFTNGKALLSATALALALFPAEHLLAQLDEVVVTARKMAVEERAQDVPISISAISGDDIEAAFAENLTDVGLLLPNVSLDDAGVFPGTSNYSIRGMGFVSTIASTEPTVGVFVDGIYLGANLGGAPDTFDQESVEVLRGPQGTLFGRNVTGGAVVMRSRRPTGEFDALMRMGIGSGGRRLIAGSIEGSLAPTLAGKLYTQYSDREGDFYNRAPEDTRRFGAEEDIFARPILRWQPQDDLDITLIGEYGRKQGDGPAARILHQPGTVATDTGIPAPSGTRTLLLDEEGSLDIEWYQAVLDASWEIGHGALTSITGFRDVSYFSEGEEGSPADMVYALNAMEQDQFSQELRYAGQLAEHGISYTTGIYYLQQDLEQKYRLDFFGTPTFVTRGRQKHRTASVFAHGDYEFVSNWFATLGLRYTWEEKRATVARGNDCDVNFDCQFPFRDQTNWNDLSPKVGLSWTPRENMLAYASWTRGFRSGGYNTRTTGADESPGPYDEETVDAYEAGIKTQFLDNRAQVNFAVFHNSFEDLQRAVFNPDSFANEIINAAEATIEGAELEGIFQPLPNLTLNGSVGYTDARYDRFDLLDVNGDGTADPRQARGLQLIRAPEWTFAASATYDHTLPDQSVLSGRIAYSYTDEAPVNDANTRFLDSYGLLDASLAWQTADERFKLSLWGRNLTNELYATTGSVSAQNHNIYQNLPRRYGVEMQVSY